MSTEQPPLVVRPEASEMASEPAKTIGQIFADKKMVNTFVSALVGIIALVFKFAIDDALVDNITTVVTLGSLAFSAFFAQWDARKRALAQASQTREQVYSSAKVEELTKTAASTGEVTVVTVPQGAPLEPSPAMTVVEQVSTANPVPPKVTRLPGSGVQPTP